MVMTNSEKEIIPFVAPPLLFNSIKHHMGVIQSMIDYSRKHPETASWGLQQLETIGNPVTDIYLGELSVKSIIEQIEKLLKQNKIFEEPKYNSWLKASGRDYNCLELSDGSRWLFRFGEKPGRYIHFHPAKHSPLSLRARGSTLRTAMAVSMLFNDSEKDCIEKVNQVRRDFLGLSPIKRLTTDNGIGKFLKGVCLKDMGKTLPLIPSQEGK
jgi:hypothetical protein